VGVVVGRRYRSQVVSHQIDRARLEPCPVVAIHPYGQVAETIFSDSTLKCCPEARAPAAPVPPVATVPPAPPGVPASPFASVAPVTPAAASPPFGPAAAVAPDPVDIIPTISTLWFACAFKFTVAAGSRFNVIVDPPDVPTALEPVAPAFWTSAFSRTHVPVDVPGLTQPTYVTLFPAIVDDGCCEDGEEVVGLPAEGCWPAGGCPAGC
jgi:hypothetical protein